MAPDAASFIIATPRLTLREVTATDAPFMLALLNDPGFIENIGDRGVRSVEDAERYVADRVTASYREHGYGMYLVATGEGPIGLCGFVRREGLPAPDLGFAYLRSHVRRGYGLEAGKAMLAYGCGTLGIDPVLAIVRPGNVASVALLRRLGFVEEGMIVLPGYPDGSLLLRDASL